MQRGLLWASTGALAIAAFAARASAQGVPPPPMQAGGLTPPPPMQSGGLVPPPPGSGPPAPPPPVPNATQQNLERANDEDSGRGLEFVYFEAGGGGEFVSLDAFNSSGLVVPDGSAFGPVVSVSSGLRLLYLTIGPRFRFGHFGDFNLWTLNLDLGWHIPLGKFEPYAFVGGGFAKLGYSGTITDAAGITLATPSLSSSGFDVRLGGGADYYVSNVFSVGATLSAELIGLWRTDDTVILNDKSGSSLGIGVTGAALLGFHF